MIFIILWLLQKFFFSFFKLTLCIFGWESSYECAKRSGSADICPASLKLTLWCYRYLQLLCFYVISCQIYTLEKQLYGPFCKYFKLLQTIIISVALLDTQKRAGFKCVQWEVVWNAWVWKAEIAGSRGKAKDEDGEVGRERGTTLTEEPLTGHRVLWSE